jgi:hypothetical protein
MRKAVQLSEENDLGSKNRIYVLHRGMRDVQAALANGGGISIMQTQDRITVRLKRRQRTHGVISTRVA